MSDKSKIEWTDDTRNPIRAENAETGAIGWYCEHESEGCRNCYAERMNRWRGNGLAYLPSLRQRGAVRIFLDEDMLLAPLRQKRGRRIFWNDMSDLFGEWVPDAWIDRHFALFALTPQHTHQVLTKRAARMRAYLCEPSTRERIEHAQRATNLPPTHNDPEHVKDWPLPNVWGMVSVEDQATADARIPELLAAPLAVRGISLEPMLGPVNLTSIGGTIDALDGTDYEAIPPPGREYNRDGTLPRLDWVIVGGESGPGARPMHPAWVRAVRDQCGAVGVAFFFKQWGEYEPLGVMYPKGSGGAASLLACKGLLSGRHIEQNGFAWLRVGKKAAGRVLDGRTWDEVPAPHPKSAHPPRSLK